MRLFSFFKILVFSFLIGTISAQSTEQQTLIIEFDKLLAVGVDSSKIVGAAGALIVDGEVVWKDCYGYADKKNKIKMSDSSTTCIGSVSKPITAMAVMMLHQNGRLDINDPVVKYIPEFSINCRGYDINKITIKSIIDHCAGLPKDNFDYSSDSLKNYASVVKLLKDEYLITKPDLVSHYSNLGYGLLGVLIKKVTGEEYPDFMHKHFFEPMGLQNTGFVDYKNIKNRSITYDSDFSEKKLPTARNLAAGSIHSSLKELTILAKELIDIYHGKDNGILSETSVKKIFSLSDKNIILDQSKTGFGWSVCENDSSQVIYHLGSNHVSNAGIMIDPEKKNAAVFLINTVGGLESVIEGLNKFIEFSGVSQNDFNYSQIINIKKSEFSENKIIKLDNLKTYAGNYALSNVNYSIDVSGDSLFFIGRNKLWLAPLSENEFVPVKIVSKDSTYYYADQRFYFKNITGDKYLFWESATTQFLIGKKNRWENISEIWHKRLGSYENKSIDFVGWDKFKKVSLYFEDGLIKLKIFYTSGEYIYNLYTIDDNHLAFYELGETGGEIISFSNNSGKDVVKIFGLKLYKLGYTTQ